MEPDHRSEGFRAGAANLGPLAFMGALAEMTPVPFIIFDADGSIRISNRLASQLLVVSPDHLQRRVLTFDGTDLWDVIAAKRSQAALLLTEVPLRIRTSSSRFVDVTFVVSTLGGFGSQPPGMLVIAYDVPDKLDASGEHPHPLDSSIPGEDVPFESIVRLLAEHLGADAAVFAEIDPDRPLSARTIAAVLDGQVPAEFEWSLPGTPIIAKSGKHNIAVETGLRESFPEDQWAAAEGFDSFAAVFLAGVDGRNSGVLAVYSRNPNNVPDVTAGVLRLFATRLLSPLRALIGQRSLSESEERYSAIFERSHLPMLLIDPTSTQIVDANEAACDFYGFSYGDITTMSVLQINTLPPDDVQQELKRAVGKVRNYFQFHHRLADGTVRDVEVYANPISIHSRELLFEIVHDVTERHQTEYELERYKQQLEELLQRRTDDLIRTNVELQQTTAASDAFYENVGAEFRTPLHTIIGFSDLLSRGMVGELNEEQVRQVGMILDAGRSLEALVDDVIELSRLDTGAESCEPEDFDISDLVHSIAIGIRPVAEECHLALEVSTPEEAMLAYSDRNKVEQILLQLLANAIKYTDEGSIKVDVTEVDADSVSVAVTDTGRGIDASELPHIFEEFRQVARQVGGTHEGTGLGLAVCRRLAEILDGSIGVESEVGRGSTFTLTFPKRCV